MKHRFPPYLIIAFLLGIAISACQRPKNVLDRKKMESLMYDIYVGEALMENDYQTFGSSEKKEAFLRSIFEKHHATQEQWDTSLVYYSDKIDVYLRMNDSVRMRIQRQQKTIEYEQNRIQLLKQEIDRKVSSDSYIPSTYTFAEACIRPGFRFRLDSAGTANLIGGENQFEFSFDVIGIPSSATPTLNALLILEYKDTTIYQANDISHNQPYKSTASKFISNDTLKTISGFVRLKNHPLRFGGVRLYRIHLGPTQFNDTIPGSENAQDSLTNAPLTRPEHDTLINAREKPTANNNL